MRRRRRRLSTEGIELNLAAMLDMAFQLLMFFILTFNPAQVESQVAAYIPAPTPLAKPKPVAAQHDSQIEQASGVVVTVAGTTEGEIKQLAVGGDIVADLAELNAGVHNAIYRQADCDEVTVQVDPGLCYEHLMRVIDICTQQELPQGGKLSKLKLVELRAE